MKRIYLKILLGAALLSLACTTKVSEWILLNEVPDKYVLVYYHNNPLNESERMQNAELKNRFKEANILFTAEMKGDIKTPYYTLYFKNDLIAEFNDFNALKKLANSPLREQIATELKNGKLCVMLYLKTGNEEKDRKGLDSLNKTLQASAFGNIISVLELDRKGVEEKLLVSMLLNVENDLKFIDEPMLFGIFGRFRVLEPLLAKGISEENIKLMIDFLTADCSCLIKDNLPGRSILINDSWENPKPAMVNTILDANPELMHN